MKLHLLAVCLSLLPACHVAATSPGHRYIVKLCETSWLDRDLAALFITIITIVITL